MRPGGRHSRTMIEMLSQLALTKSFDVRYTACRSLWANSLDDPDDRLRHVARIRCVMRAAYAGSTLYAGYSSVTLAAIAGRTTYYLLAE